MKKYGVVKIKDPSAEGHTIKLLPFQAFEISFIKRSLTDSFKLSILGKFLVLTETKDTKTSVTFKVQQKYNMTGWAKFSTTFMGNVVISKMINGVFTEQRLCVYCTAEQPTKDNVITVINPDNCLVKIEPHHVIHIVMYDGDSLQWSMENPDSLKCVRCETVINDFQGVYDPEALFCPEPRSHGLPMNEKLIEHPPEFFSNEVMGCKGFITEYHFWSCLTSSEVAKLNNSPNGSYEIGVISLQGKLPGATRVSFRQMEVMLSVRGDKRKLNLEHFKAIYSLAKCWNERSLSYVRHSIFNPRTNEDLDVSESDGWFYLEVPSPQVYFPEFDKENRWTCENIDGTSIQCHHLRSRHINGNEVQRFFISGISINKESTLMGVGMLMFSVSDGGVSRIMTINFWKIPVSEERQSPPTRSTATRMSERIEIDLEVMVDNKLAEDECITPLSMIDPDDIDYEYYDYGCYFPFEKISKKNMGALIPAFSMGNMSLLSMRNIGS